VLTHPSTGIFSLLKGEITPSWHPPDPGHIQKQLGTGYQDHPHWSFHRRLPPMAKSKQNVCLHRQWSSAEIIINNFFLTVTILA
jgi:hypothetical protein